MSYGALAQLGEQLPEGTSSRALSKGSVLPKPACHTERDYVCKRRKFAQGQRLNAHMGVTVERCPGVLQPTPTEHV